MFSFLLIFYIQQHLKTKSPTEELIDWYILFTNTITSLGIHFSINSYTKRYINLQSDVFNNIATCIQDNWIT